jgi:hypothetical protein
MRRMIASKEAKEVTRTEQQRKKIDARHWLD